MNKIFLLSLLVGLIAVSCTDPNTIGLEVQPTSDNILINSADFTNFNAATESVDSLRTDEALSLILGELDDSDFGNNRSSFYSQILLTDNNTDLGINPTVDSVVLSYTYSGYYGTSAALADFTSIDVLVLQDDIYKDSVYYSTSYPIPMPGGMSYIESFSVSNDTEKPLLKVKLSNDFGDLILDLENEGLKDNEVFLENFKGISVVASAQNTMLYLNPDGSNSYLKIYYHNQDNDSLSLDFELGGDAARINLFNEKNNNAIIEDDSNVHLQSMAGYKAKITLGDLDVIKDTLEGKVINKVTIDFDVELGSQSEYKEAHEKLVLVRVDNEGNNVFLTDFTVEGETHFGGKLEGDIYSFNITRYFYQLLNNSSYTNDLYLMPAGAAINANRTILSKDIKLTIHYSEL